MILILENGKRSTRSKRKSANPISPGEMMDHTARRAFGSLLVSAVIVVWLLARGNMRTWGLSGITRVEIRDFIRSYTACPGL